MTRPLFAVRCSLFALTLAGSAFAQMGTWSTPVNHPSGGVQPPTATWPSAFQVNFDQRYVELAIVPTPALPPGVAPVDADGVYVQIPASPVTSATVNQVTALPGYYLLFLVSNLGYVSDGRWVRLL